MRRIVIPSPAPPEAVLAAIREDGREWRESVVPPELRGELRHRVEVRVKGDRFRLALPSRLEGPENVTLHGMVSPAPDGGSLVHVRFASGSPTFWAVVAGAGALTLAANPAWGLFLLAAAALLGGVDAWRGSRLDEEGSPVAAYLAERLRAAVLRAPTGAGREVPAGRRHPVPRDNVLPERG
jgi:hypothetical protein